MGNLFSASFGSSANRALAGATVTRSFLKASPTLRKTYDGVAVRIPVDKSRASFREPCQISDCGLSRITVVDAGAFALQCTVFSDNEQVSLTGPTACDENLRWLEFRNLKHGLTPS
jgi:hypothetical protein